MRFVANRDTEAVPSAAFWKSFDAHHFKFAALERARRLLQERGAVDVTDSWTTRRLLEFCEQLPGWQESPEGPVLLLDALGPQIQPVVYEWGVWHQGMEFESSEPITALRLEDGKILYDTQARIHADMLKRGIQPEEIADGGWIVNGEYHSGSADAPGIADRAKAAKRAAANRAHRRGELTEAVVRFSQIKKDTVQALGREVDDSTLNRAIDRAKRWMRNAYGSVDWDAYSDEHNGVFSVAAYVQEVEGGEQNTSNRQAHTARRRVRENRIPNHPNRTRSEEEQQLFDKRTQEYEMLAPQILSQLEAFQHEPTNPPLYTNQPIEKSPYLDWYEKFERAPLSQLKLSIGHHLEKIRSGMEYGRQESMQFFSALQGWLKDQNQLRESATPPKMMTYALGEGPSLTLILEGLVQVKESRQSMDNRIVTSSYQTGNGPRWLVQVQTRTGKILDRKIVDNRDDLEHVQIELQSRWGGDLISLRYKDSPV